MLRIANREKSYSAWGGSELQVVRALKSIQIKHHTLFFSPPFLLLLKHKFLVIDVKRSSHSDDLAVSFGTAVLYTILQLSAFHLT